MELRKHRKCPCCGGKTGFNVTVFLGGHVNVDVKFNGTIIKEERVGTDMLERYAVCLDCKKSLYTDRLDTRNV